MRGWLDWIMDHRAKQLTRRLRPWIPAGSSIADIGSGTGHNAQHWRTTLGAQVTEYDVSDLHWVGTGPVLFDGLHLPVADGSYPIVTALFVLQYSPHPIQLLNELRRVSGDRVLVIQSTYRGAWGRAWLNLRGIIWGPIAFWFARILGLIRGTSCPLISRTLYSRQELKQLFHQAGLTVLHWEPEAWRGLMISRDLYVLQASPQPATCPSSSPLVMKNAG